MPLNLEDIETLFARRGGEQYSGEPVTQLAHALQTAQRAERDGADDPLVTAALLHDLGHLLNEQGESPSLRGIDDLHQFYALPFLHGVFDEQVLAPIRLRLWDDLAQEADCPTPPLAHFLARAQRCMLK